MLYLFFTHKLFCIGNNDLNKSYIAMMFLVKHLATILNDVMEDFNLFMG